MVPGMLSLHWGKGTKLSWKSTLAFATKMCSWGKIIIKRKKNSKNKKKNPGVPEIVRENETICNSNRIVIRLWNLSHPKGACSPGFFSWPKLPFPSQSKRVQCAWEVQGTSSQFPSVYEEECSGGSYSNLMNFWGKSFQKAKPRQTVDFFFYYFFFNKAWYFLECFVIAEGWNQRCLCPSVL